MFAGTATGHTLPACRRRSDSHSKSILVRPRGTTIGALCRSGWSATSGTDRVVRVSPALRSRCLAALCAPSQARPRHARRRQRRLHVPVPRSAPRAWFAAIPARARRIAAGVQLDGGRTGGSVLRLAIDKRSAGAAACADTVLHRTEPILPLALVRAISWVMFGGGVRRAPNRCSSRTSVRTRDIHDLAVTKNQADKDPPVLIEVPSFTDRRPPDCASVDWLRQPPRLSTHTRRAPLFYHGCPSIWFRSSACPDGHGVNSTVLDGPSREVGRAQPAFSGALSRAAAVGTESTSSRRGASYPGRSPCMP